MDQLDLLLMKAERYSNFILENQRTSNHLAEANTSTPDAADSSGKRKTSSGKGSSKDKKAKTPSGQIRAASGGSSAVSASAPGGGGFRQPANLVGGTLLPYQLDGLRWLLSLFENGLSGILADEMGLGKTIQIISLVAHLRMLKTGGPFLIAGPLAVVENWVAEFKKWLPSCPVLLYHASKDERAELRRKHMKISDQKDLNFPVIITSFEMCIIDRPHLERYNWQYIILDEGHRIKNRNCRLIRELKQLPSVSRLLLTGTPIQNSLEELWSLLNFVAPIVFDDIETFRSWFDFGKDKLSSVEQIINEENQQKIVTKLHEIMRPFVLRRVKKEVLSDKIPPKREIVVYCGMSSLQREYYSMVLGGTIRDNLVTAGVPHAKNISQINTLMNLRKVCNHPFLFGDIIDSDGRPLRETNLRLTARASGKFSLLDRMLPRLKAAGNKVLIFSQMTELLDVLEDYLILKDFVFVRFDGSTKRELRQEYINRFNKDKTVFIFLLSTRAGGLGINLTAADTCILFDSDWNPHQDAQAQDRCHRIGQRVPVVTYRFLTSGSVEIDMLKKQMSKNKLARLTITGGDYRMGGMRRSQACSVADLRVLLEDDVKNISSREDYKQNKEGENNESEELAFLSKEISDAELDLIMDRNLLFDANSRLYTPINIDGTGNASLGDDSAEAPVPEKQGKRSSAKSNSAAKAGSDRTQAEESLLASILDEEDKDCVAEASSASKAYIPRRESCESMGATDGDSGTPVEEEEEDEGAAIKVRFEGEMYDIVTTGKDEIFMSIEH